MADRLLDIRPVAAQPVAPRRVAGPSAPDMCSPRCRPTSARSSSSRKNTRSKSASDGAPAYRPYAAASSSVRNSTRIDRKVGPNHHQITYSDQAVTMFGPIATYIGTANGVTAEDRRVNATSRSVVGQAPTPRTAQNTRSGPVTTATLATQVADHIGGSACVIHSLCCPVGGRPARRLFPGGRTGTSSAGRPPSRRHRGGGGGLRRFPGPPALAGTGQG